MRQKLIMQKKLKNHTVINISKANGVRSDDCTLAIIMIMMELIRKAVEI